MAQFEVTLHIFHQVGSLYWYAIVLGYNRLIFGISGKVRSFPEYSNMSTNFASYDINLPFEFKFIIEAYSKVLHIFRFVYFISIRHLYLLIE